MPNTKEKLQAHQKKVVTESEKNGLNKKTECMVVNQRKKRLKYELRIGVFNIQQV